MPRSIFLAAMLASVLAHGVALAVLVVRGQTVPTQPEPGAEPPSAIEVRILADPRAGTPSAAPDETDATGAEPSAQPDQAQAAAEPAAPLAAPLAEQPVDARAEPTATPQPAELTDAPPPPAPLSPPPLSPPPLSPPLPSPPRTAAAPPRPPNPAQARPPAGATTDGRDAGTTDIILGANTAPPGVDPTALNTPPRYPPEAVRRGQQGTVQLRVLVATDGSAVTVEVAQSSGSALLDRAAREAVAKWRFRPAQQTGITIPTILPVSLSFSLIDTP